MKYWRVFGRWSGGKITVIFCIAEHWLKESSINLVFPKDFYNAGSFCRKDTIRGGTLVLVHKMLGSETINVEKCCSEIDFEASVAIIKSLKIIVVSIYHSPGGTLTILYVD